MPSGITEVAYMVAGKLVVAWPTPAVRLTMAEILAQAAIKHTMIAALVMRVVSIHNITAVISDWPAMMSLVIIINIGVLDLTFGGPYVSNEF